MNHENIQEKSVIHPLLPLTWTIFWPGGSLRKGKEKRQS